MLRLRFPRADDHRKSRSGRSALLPLQRVKGKKVTCTVKYSASASSAKCKNLRWRLMRGGHAYSHGRTDTPRLQLDLSHLRKGRYVIHVQGQAKNTVIVVS